MRIRRSGFTLVELLTVIAIIALLAAIIFPVFATAREKGRQATCQSNLRQMGMALRMYALDYDGYHPWAIDASDGAVPEIWPAEYQPRLAQMTADNQFIHVVLNPYIKNQQMWRCPSDSGFDVLDNNDSCGGPCPMPAQPTMYEAHGASYLYRTEISFKRKTIDDLTGWRVVNGQWQDVGQAAVNVFFDGNGSWHGGMLRRSKRYMTLFGDGHTKLMTRDQLDEAWATYLDPPGN